MAGQFIKGALISFMPTFLGATPNVIIFQINPETITHTWTAAGGESPGEGKPGTDPLAVKGLPGESFAFTLSMDANDMIADGATNPLAAGLATLTGVYTRLAALEMLQYPSFVTGPVLVGAVSAALSAAGAGSDSSQSQEQVPRLQVPTVLFVWGPERIVPVRVMALTVTEKLYDIALNPTHADAQMTLRVLTQDELVNIKGPMADIANAAYAYTQNLRQVQAMANLGDSAASILGMLPTPF
jgi:flagellar basal body rod protein FlgC